MRRVRSVLLAVAIAVIAWATPARAQVPSLFALDVHRSIDRGIAWLANNYGFSIDANGNAEAGDAAALMALVLLEKRADARPTAVSEGYVGANATDRAHIDRLIAYLIAKQNNFFYAYRNGPEMMALSLYVRTGGPNPDARAALDRAVDEAIYAIGQQVPCTSDGEGGCLPDRPDSPVPCLVWRHENGVNGCYPVFNEPTDAQIQNWHGYWGYHLTDTNDSSTTQFVVAGLGAARGVYLNPNFADAARLALVDKVLARSRQAYAQNGNYNQACSAGTGPLGSGFERGHAYGLNTYTTIDPITFEVIEHISSCDPGSGNTWFQNSLQQTASGLWIQLLGGSTLNDDGVQRYLEWLHNRYAFSSIAGQPWSNASYGYYLWSSAKAYFFLERAGATPANASTLTSANLGTLAAGSPPAYAPRETHLASATVPRPTSAGPEGAGYYNDIREPERWYFDYAYSLVSRQCWGGLPAGLSLPAGIVGWEGLPAQPCGDTVTPQNDGYFVPVNGRWPGFTGMVAEQAYFILILQRSVGGGCLDTDGDGFCDTDDNCPAVANPAQVDGDGDHIGDACDVCPTSATNDPDGDGLCGDVDICPLASDPGQQVNPNGEPLACSPGVIQATDDTGAAVDSLTGGQSLFNVQVNDTLNGNPIVVGQTLIRQLASTNGGVTLLGSKVNVAAGTPVGTYLLDYEICEVAYPTNCDAATVTVPVVIRNIDARPDIGAPVLSSTGGVSVPNVLVNDVLNGAQAVAGAVDVFDWSTADVEGVYQDPQNMSSVVVAPGTPAGLYTLEYQICEAGSSENCDVALVTVPVINGPIDAVDDTGSAIDGNVGGVSLENIFLNDTLSGQPVHIDNVDPTTVSTTHPGIFLDWSDVNRDWLAAKVRPGTPPGTYTLTYRICETLTGTLNCDTAVVTVPVNMPPIDAINDVGSPVSGLTGGTSLLSVLPNDTLENELVTPADVRVTPVPTADLPPSPPLPLHPGVSVSGLGVVVAPGTPAGTYAVYYRLCQVLYPGNCDDAMVTVTVTAAPIDAINDAGASVNGASGGTSFTNVLGNDTLGGVAVIPSGVTTTFVSATHTGVTLSGVNVVVAAGTPAGSYSLTYQICDNLNPASNCDTALVTVPVAAAAIDAADDTGVVVNGANGGTSFANVLSGDTLNGQAVAAVNVITTQVSATHAGVSLNGLNVVVAPGTPAGSYSLVYRICEVLNSDNCDTAMVTVPVVAAAIDAVNDTGNTVNGASGGTSWVSVLTSDTLNGVPVVAGSVTTTFVSSTNAGVSLSGLSVVVAPGTALGSYSLTYKICENLNPATNCDTATVAVPVAAAPIDARNDLGASVNSVTGGTSFTNVLGNDTFNGAAVIAANVATTQVSSTHPGVSLSGLDVVVAPGTPAGTYTLTYRICEVLNPSNCDTATVSVPIVPAAIDAVNDTGASVNGASGGSSFTNVLGNDTLNGVAVIAADVVATQVSSTHAGVSLSGVDVVVAAGTQATPANAPYVLTYRICEVLNSANCDTATVTVPVAAAVIDATNDAGAPVNGATGGTSFSGVLGNDTLNGAAVAAADVVTTQVSSTHPGVSLSGVDVVVAPWTPATPANAPYVLTYRICEVLNPANCDQATVTVPVLAAPIDAVDDLGASVNGMSGGQSVQTVLVNDTLSGVPVEAGRITLTFVSSTSANVTLTGRAVSVAPGTQAGTYSLVYRICEVMNPENCDQATVTVPVTAAPIDARDDEGSVTSLGGVAVPNVLVSDLLNNGRIPEGGVTTAFVSATHPGVTLSGTGVVVAPGTLATPPGSPYQLVYEICEVLNPTNCDRATVRVTVTAPVIDAVNDAGAVVNGATGGTSFTNVLVSDTLNGGAVAAASVNLSLVSSTHPGVSLTGSNVVVAAGTPAGNYSLTYRICDAVNVTNCDDATVTVTVTAAVIDAINDSGTVNGFTGGTAVASVLTNDRLNDAPVVPELVTIRQVSTSNTGVTLSGASVVVAAGTPAGDYTLVYEICEILNPGNCDQATVTVTVTAPVIDAVNDAGAPVNGGTGGTSFTNVLGNDTLNGAAVVAANVVTSFVSSTHAGVTLSGANVVVAAGTPAGSYSLTYRICEVLNSTNCDDAVVAVPVTAPVIDAVNDAGVAVNGATGGTSFTGVLGNDTLNGAAVVAANVVTSFVSSTHPGVTLSGANVVVAGATAAGTYSLVYRICEVLNATNCDQATVTVPVTAPVIDAVNDAGASVNGATGGTSFTNVLGNDTLNGAAVVPAGLSLSTVSATHAGVTLSGPNVVVAAGTPAGSYSLTYRICEVLNPGNCDTATVTVTVTAPVIDAVNDTGAAVNGATGGTSFTNVLVSDTLNGTAVVATGVSLSLVSSTHPGVSLTGSNVVVAAGTPAGNYSLTYRICDAVNVTNCDDATVTVTVTAPLIDAIDDSGVSVSSASGGTSVANVLVNDRLNGVLVPANTVATTFVSSTHAGVTLVGTSVVVAAGTPSGTYALVYRICELLNPDNCDTATVTVPVNALPGVSITKTASLSSAAPFQPVTYTYVVRNTGGTILASIEVKDDNGTPKYPYDDFVVGTVPSLAPGASVTLTATVFPVVSTTGTVNGATVQAGSMIVTALANGDIKATYLQNFGINDNTYGTGAIGWPNGHKFADLTGSDKLEFRFVDRTGRVAVDFYLDALSAASSVTVPGTGQVISYPAGYGSLGPFGGDGSWVAGDRNHIVSFSTSITENLNTAANLPNKAALILNSPTSLVGGDVVVNTTAAPGGWNHINSYSVVVKAAAFGTAGFGGVSVPDQHNSPNKLGGPHAMTPKAVNSTVVNTATVTTSGLTVTTTASVSIIVPGAPPVAVNDSATTSPGVLVTIPVLTNDSDPDGDTLTIIGHTTPTSGTLVLNANGTFSYTPEPDFTGTVTFTYTISDGKGGTATATVTILVNATGTCDDRSDDGKSHDGSSGDSKSGDAKSGKAHDGKSQDGKSQSGTGDSKSGKSHDGKSQDGRSGDDKSCDDNSSNDHSSDHSSHDHHSGGNHGDNCHGTKGHGHHTHDGCPVGAHQKRMTGGGSVFTTGNDRVTHGMILHCDAKARPNNLEINWGKGQKFHLDALLGVTCSDDPRISPQHPVASFDTMVGTGTGSHNGVSGATVAFTLTDAGEPGKSDTATLTVKDNKGKVVLTVSGPISNGNQQAHDR